MQNKKTTQKMSSLENDFWYFKWKGVLH